METSRRMTMLWQLLIVVALGSVAAAILFPVFIPRHPPSHRSSCQSNLKQIGLAFQQYIQDYHERFPIASNAAPWVDALQPYTKSIQLFHCPSATIESNTLTTYWFNARIKGVPQSKLEATALTVTSGDGEVSADPNISITQLPAPWLEEGGIARRHLEGANYGFADGHVKWFKYDRAPGVVPPKEGKPTFLVR